jgi:acetyl-CoA carboxylase biotin carboxyl carrier protein
LNNKKRTSKATGGRGTAKRAENSAPASGSPMDVRVLEQIVKLMSANDLNTIEVRDGDRRVLLKRGADVVVPSASSGFYATPQVSAPSPGLATGAASGAGSASTSTPAVTDEANQLTIKSPMVGTFYSAPSPEAKPFVSVGTVVDEETDVCVIEAMKVFNNIKAECRGTIARILVTNGQTVEFGQPLFLVKP